jgi:hypothetical protein
MKSFALAALTALVPLAAAGCVAESPDDTNVTLEQPLAIVPTGATCADLGLGNLQYDVTPPYGSSYVIDGSTITLGFYDDTHTFFFFTSNGLRLDGVLATAAGRTAVWDFGTESNGWGSLFAPLDQATGEFVEPEVISFCYDYELLVNPNAYAAYAKRHTWDIAKTSSTVDLLLSAGQTFLAGYDVTVSLVGVEDAGYEIDGPVFIHNHSPFPTTLSGVTVFAGEIEATVTCPYAFPWTLAPGTSLECSYVTVVPDASDRLVVVTVTTSDGLPGATGSELASFSFPTTFDQLIDECVKVEDDRVGFLGTVCAVEGTKTFHYTMEIGPFDSCGDFSVPNVATFTALDTGVSGDASYTVTVDVPCSDGCSLTQGYWKTHSEHGPAPYDDTWEQLPDGVDTTFFLSGTTYYGALWTTPAGNPYWSLAHQYIAALMNQHNGANVGAVSAEMSQAATILATYTPLQIKNGSKVLKAQIVALAGALEAYNSGATGPGHCDE